MEANERKKMGVHVVSEVVNFISSDREVHEIMRHLFDMLDELIVRPALNVEEGGLGLTGVLDTSRGDKGFIQRIEREI